jgi:hypothetical protein
MGKKIALVPLFMLALALALTVPEARAQGPDDGTEQVGDYQVTSSTEFGVRGVKVDGNADKYRSDLNYDPGLRMFDSSLLMRAADGDGKLFDTFLVHSTGWGADPTGYLRVNLEKTKWYKLDANVRRFDYFNYFQTFALNQHLANTDHDMGDFDLTILPQSDIRFNVGYSYDRLEGPVLTTYDFSRDEFPIQSDRRNRADNWRFGVDARLGPIDISFLQGFRRFRDDTTYFITNFQPGNSPTTPSFLDSLRQDLPSRGRVNFSRLSLHTLIKDRLDLVGRVIYSSATTRFSLFETLSGGDFSGNEVVSDQYSASGDAKRPQIQAELAGTWLATDKLRISNTFQAHLFRINGGQLLSQSLFTVAPDGTPRAPVFGNLLAFRTTAYRRVANTTELDYQFGPRFSAHVGYRYSDRHIELFGSDRDLPQPEPTDEEPEEFDNRTNTFFGGFKARPFSRWTVYFDVDRGETDNVFTRIENYNFVNVRVRSRYKPTDTLSLNFTVSTKDNENPSVTETMPAENFGADINSRIYSVQADWSPGSRFSLSSGYTYTHITSEADIIFYINNVRQFGESRYFMKDNYAYLNTYVQIHPRVSFFGSYRIHKDTGQGDRVPPTPNILIASYPLQFQAPEARVSVRLHDRVDFSAGYQYFDFKEKFFNVQHYKAHLPYGSLRFYIGRGGN